MATIKPFSCIRPAVKVAAQVAALPYDVYNRSEACEEVKDKPLSFLRIDRAETQFDKSVDTYDERVYLKAKELLDGMKEVIDSYIKRANTNIDEHDLETFYRVLYSFDANIEMIVADIPMRLK